MTAQEIKAAIAAYEGKRLTSQDRATIADIVTPYGVVIRSTRCKNCYMDALYEAYHRAKAAERQPAATTGAGSWHKFKFSKPVTVGGRTFSALTPQSVIARLEHSEPALYRVLYSKVAAPVKASVSVTPAAVTTQEEPSETDDTPETEQASDGVTTDTPNDSEQ